MAEANFLTTTNWVQKQGTPAYEEQINLLQAVLKQKQERVRQRLEAIEAKKTATASSAPEKKWFD